MTDLNSMIEAEQQQQHEQDIDNMAYKLRDHTNRSTNLNNKHFLERLLELETFEDVVGEMVSSNSEEKNQCLNTIGFANRLIEIAKELASEMAEAEVNQ